MVPDEPPVEASTPRLSLAEHIVLALVAEHATHGFAVARLVGPGATMGDIFRIPRPIVYRALDRLLAAELIEVDEVQPSPTGPQRTRYRISSAGREMVDAWLAVPVAHIRDIRTEFLVKLVLLERSGMDIDPLVGAQRRTLAPIIAALGERDPGRGFDRVVHSWRRQTALAALRFLDDLAASDTQSGV
ncbi:MAG: PadR family transcriptional regulator [Acidimicrobiales bacterium]|nr:PadR family transcriptional regulator [Acidimicrobiales bacterium]